MDAVEYRLARPADTLALEALMRAFVRWNAEASGEGAAWFLPDWSERCAWSAQEAVGHALVAVIRGRVVGYSALFGDERDGLYIARDCAGRGIGERLFRLTLEAHKVAGAAQHSISVFAWNEGARRLYRKLGGVEKMIGEGEIQITFDLL